MWDFITSAQALVSLLVDVTAGLTQSRDNRKPLYFEFCLAQLFLSTEFMALMWSEIDPAAPAARASASPPQAAWEFSQKEGVLRGGGRSKWDMSSLGCGQEEQINLVLVKSRVCCH